MQTDSRLTRREAIKKTIVFSSGMLAARFFSPLFAQAPRTDFPEKGIHLLAFGDYGTDNVYQKSVAEQMAVFTKKLGAPLNSVLALGDNFYGMMQPERFRRGFEEMYPQEVFDCPFYACLGNHDYGPQYDSKQGREKAQMQLDYAAQNPGSRWKLPDRWHSVELPNTENPLVKIIFLDGNFFEGALTPQEKLTQKRYFDTEIARETRAPWRWVISHYPMFSQTTSRGNNDKLIERWGAHLREYNISLYLAGHDHNLQHLEVEGYPTSFIVSGAGGAGLYDVSEPAQGFTSKILGFNHLHVTRDHFTVQYIDTNGLCLHSFRKALDGKITYPNTSPAVASTI